MEHNDRQFLLRRLGAWIQNLRKSQGISQDKLTGDAGLAKGTISKIESGSVDPKFTTLARIALALKMRVAKLLDFLDR